MKKVFFSFLAIFCFFIAFNSCQALTINGDNGISVEISDEYVSYICFNNATSNNGGTVIASKVKGVFKKNWVSGQGSYMVYFYPDGSTTYTTFDAIYLNSGSDNMSTFSGATCITFITDEFFQGNTTLMFGKVRGTDSHYEGEIIYQPIPEDPAIGDASSKLKLTYEYNEEFTECKINATLEGGAFTDKIYYSNYQPGVSGELLTKKGFPSERSHSYRKSIFIFSSRR